MGARFSAPVQTGSGTHPASCTMGTVSFPEVKRSWRGVDHPPPSSAEVKERVELYLYSPLGLHERLWGELHLFTYNGSLVNTNTPKYNEHFRTAVMLLHNTLTKVSHFSLRHFRYIKVQSDTVAHSSFLYYYWRKTHGTEKHLPPVARRSYLEFKNIGELVRKSELPRMRTAYLFHKTQHFSLYGSKQS
jgi:hypothetical protein